MPTSARKSSLGAAARRGPQKAHIPYRGDNPEVGKKTGIAVQHVERKSDGFEPFDKLIQQADGHTPPPPDRRKKQSLGLDSLDDYDEDGEQSMDVASPLQYVANSRRATTPVNLGRVGSSSRPVARTSEVDFDRVPSPRAQSSSRRVAQSPGPSRLSKSFHARDRSPDSDADPRESGNFDGGGGGMDDDGFDDYGPQEGDNPSPEQTSFMEIDRDEDDDDQQQEEDEELPVNSPVDRSKSKGKRRMVEEEDEDEPEAEHDIDRGLNDVDMQPVSGDEDEEEEESPRSKKTRLAAERAKQGKKTIVKGSKKENRPVIEGVRRSKREHYKPLQWWRCEKVVYGHPNKGSILVPHIKEIIRIPMEPVEPLSKKRKRSKSKTAAVPDPDPPVVLYNPEEGWDDKLNQDCDVLDYEDMEVRLRRIAVTAKMVKPQAVGNNEWTFDKIFSDGDFVAAGQLHIPPHGQKPPKATKDNTYIFYIIEGAVSLKVRDTSMILCTGAMFMVPRGNTYFIENITERTTKLFFTQARKVAPGGTPSPSPSKNPTPVRSSSAADDFGKKRSMSKPKRIA